MLATAAAKKPCRPRPISFSHSVETLAASSAVLPTVAPAVDSKSATSLLVQTRLSTSTTLESTHLPTATASKSKVSKSSTSSKSTSSQVQTKTKTTTESTSSAEDSEVFIGVGTRYGGSCTEEDCWQGGACSFSGYDLPANVDGSTCVSEDIWNNGANCGGCIEVSYKGTTITVMVTNLTGGNATHLDMTPSTWSKLTNGLSGGGVDGIEWQWVTCPIAETTPLEIHMHGGASKYWFAATVQNARLRTKSLEVSSDEGSTWKTTTLDNYNIFTLDGTLPNDTAWVRVTSVEGDQVVVKNVALKSSKITTATDNYA
ncbi:RlpA-like double-psi beta-barrel-protein domain-containing protein-containing protein [Ilyonectria destructans]|nr:RlpA-like double-psi beta-barrel-protein domain-containing protein-containing protein [Ilyonectria destructans]